MIALVVLSAARSAGQEPERKKLDQCGIIRQPSSRLSVRGELVYCVHCTGRCSSVQVAPEGTLYWVVAGRANSRRLSMSVCSELRSATALMV